MSHDPRLESSSFRTGRLNQPLRQDTEELHLIIRDDRIWNRAVAELHRIKGTPTLFEIIIRPYSKQRNNDQNAKLHALCRDVSKQVQWDGEWLDTEDWKRIFTAGWMKATGRTVKLVRSLDGNDFVPIFQRTSRLSTKEMAELIEFILAWCVDKDVRFYEPLGAQA